MAEQYFTKNPNSAHQRQVIDYRLNNIDLKFNTDSGVFSKNRIDYGSRVLLNNLNKLDLPQGKVLDLGCGYGPIGIYAAKIWPKKLVDMVDVNERALNLAKENAGLNHIDNINIFESNIYQNITNKYALILTNPPIRAGKKVVSQILADAKNYLVPNGKLLVVIQKKQGEPSAKKLMKATYNNCEILDRDKGYYILQSTNN